jgi:hypothetical protein
MSTTINATFDGSVFRPAEPVQLEPNSVVRLTVEKILPGKTGQPYSSLDYLASLNLDGPPDGSANIDKYLYPEDPSNGS